MRAKASLAQRWTDPCQWWQPRRQPPRVLGTREARASRACSPRAKLGRWGGLTRGPLPFEAEGVSRPGAWLVTSSQPWRYTTPEAHAERAARLHRPDAVASLSSVRWRAGVDHHTPPESARPWTGVPPALGRSGHVGCCARTRAHAPTRTHTAHTHTRRTRTYTRTARAHTQSTHTRATHTRTSMQARAHAQPVAASGGGSGERGGSGECGGSGERGGERRVMPDDTRKAEAQEEARQRHLSQERCALRPPRSSQVRERGREAAPPSAALQALPDPPPHPQEAVTVHRSQLSGGHAA